MIHATPAVIHHPRYAALPHAVRPRFRDWAEIGQEARDVADLMGLTLSHAGSLVLEMDRCELEVF